MFKEFPDISIELANNAVESYKEIYHIKFEAYKECEINEAKLKSDLRSKLSSVIFSGLHRTMREEVQPEEVEFSHLNTMKK